MEITIQSFIEEDGTEKGYFEILFNGKTSGALGYDEMLGLVSAIAMPESRPCLQWLKTPEQVQTHKNHLREMLNQKQEIIINDDSFLKK